jgi:hypothetical protein
MSFEHVYYLALNKDQNSLRRWFATVLTVIDKHSILTTRGLRLQDNSTAGLSRWHGLLDFLTILHFAHVK